MIPHIPLHMANLLLRRCQCDLPSLYFTYLVNFLPSAPLQTNFYHNVQDTYYLLLAQRVGKKKKKLVAGCLIIALHHVLQRWNVSRVLATCWMVVVK